MKETILIKKDDQTGAARLAELEETGQWVAEPKIDGEWARLTIGGWGKRNELISRQGLPNADDSLSDVVCQFPFHDFGMKPGDVIVGELESSTEWATEQAKKRGYRIFHAFDVLVFKGEDVRNMEFWQRRAMLDEVFTEIVTHEVARARKEGKMPPRPVMMVSQDRGRFLLMFNLIVSAGGEGIVLKRIDGTYQPEGKIRVDSQIKVKKHPTVDYVCMGTVRTKKLNDLTFRFGLYFSGKLTGVMTCGSDILKKVVEERGTEAAVVGLVVECAGMEIFKSGALRHAGVVRIRTDKLAKDCTWPIK